jgi:hypothetical protein
MDSEESWVLHRPYRIVEHPSFLRQACNLLGAVFYEEIKETLDAELARYPHIPSNRIPEYDSLYGQLLNTTPPIVLYYSVNDAKEEVELLEIESFTPEDYLTYEEG